MTGAPGATRIYDFSSPEAVEGWEGVNDVVMGGRSTGTAVASGAGSMLFQGAVSLANGGGFSSIRSAAGDWNLSGRTSLLLRLRGDRKRYKAGLRTDTAFDGPSWQSAFTAPEEWTDISLPFKSFVPTWHGKFLSAGGTLDPGSIRRFGILIAGGQEGPFRLEIASIGAR